MLPESQASVDAIYPRYQLLEQYVAWTPEDAARLLAVADQLKPALPAIVNDFYDEVLRHPDTRQVITGGMEQVARLKGTLTTWLRELLEGPHDKEYVGRRYRVGWRHVQIGLPAMFTNVALSRVRTGLTSNLMRTWAGEPAALEGTLISLQKRLDLDLALIEESYQAEHAHRQQQAERLVTIGQVSGGIAHELRNPLNVIKTSAYYLRSAKNLTPEKQAEHLQRMERNVEQADSVITALSSLTRMPSPRLLPVEVNSLIREVIDSEELGAGYEVRFEPRADLPMVQADPSQLRIVLGNLLRNGRDAMPQGGALDVGVEVAGDRLTIAVTDHGVGIPPEQLHRIQDPLFSTKARGLGLGLSIVRVILEKSHGSLSVTSELGKGSTFRISLPVASRGG